MPCGHRYSTRRSMSSKMWRAVTLVILGAALLVVRTGAWQQEPALAHESIARKDRSAAQGLLLLRESKTAEARKELEEQRKLRPDDAEVLYQIARSYLIDFYRSAGPRAAPRLARAGDGDPGRRLEARSRPHPRIARQGRDPRARRAAVLRSQSLLSNWPPGSRSWSRMPTRSC